MEVDFAHLCKSFALDPSLSWEPLSGGHMNQSWVGTIRGKPRYVARLYQETRRRDEIEVEHRCITGLAEHMVVRVPVPLLCVNGESIHTQMSSHIALFKYIVGTALDPASTGVPASLGRLLAECHAVLWTQRDRLNWVSSIRGPLASAEREMSEQDMRSAVQVILPDVEAVKAIQIRARQSTQLVSKAFACNHLIHGDFNPSNILFSGDSRKAVAVLDWDECRWDAPVFDLAGFLHCFGKDDDAEEAMAGYAERLSETNHPYASSMGAVIDILPDAQYAVIYNELETMLTTGQGTEEYISKLIPQLLS